MLLELELVFRRSLVVLLIKVLLKYQGQKTDGEDSKREVEMEMGGSNFKLFFQEMKGVRALVRDKERRNIKTNRIQELMQNPEKRCSWIVVMSIWSRAQQKNNYSQPGKQWREKSNGGQRNIQNLAYGLSYISPHEIKLNRTCCKASGSAKLFIPFS